MKKNLAQEEVINNIYGQMIVIACPGSGKTTTLLRRIHHMIEDEFINPSEILMITFTNAAATEMRTRYEKVYGENPGITFCTIHALCLKFLERFDGFNKNNLLTNPIDFLEDEINKLTEIDDKGKFTTELFTDISVVKNNSIDPYKYKPKCCENVKLFAELFEKYERKKKEEELFDFDDLLIRTYELIQKERDMLDWLRDRYGYIHVDEYQDTNYIQRDIIYAITGENGNLTVVGDDDQSIYAFRGAKPEIMLNFKEKYPDAIEVYMDTNYRSDKEIIKYAKNLVEHNKARFKKDIKASSEQEGEVVYKCFDGKKKEMEGIVEEINSLIANGVNPSDIAILYRTNSQSLQVADALSEIKLPFYSSENIPNRYEHIIYRDILAYHRFANRIGSPKELQRDFLTTIKHPNRYFHNIDSLKYNDDLDTMLRKTNNSFLEKWKNDKTQQNVKDYFLFLSSLKSSSPLETIDLLLEKGNYLEYIKYATTYRNIVADEWIELLDRYKYDLEKRDIDTFEDWERYAENYSRALKDLREGKTGICISTMHKSKGLEWKYVFIIDCMETICPFVKAETEEDIEEERRLFYVAMTRAKNKLYLFNYKNKKGVGASRFIHECGV